MRKTFKSIDEYMRTVPEDKRIVLGDLRRAIRAAAPSATEGFSYGMPAIKLGGKAIVCFAAFKNHCSLFPMGNEAIEHLRKELEPFRTSKGTLQFTPERPIPAALVKKIVKARIRSIEEAAQVRKEHRKPRAS